MNIVSLNRLHNVMTRIRAKELDPDAFIELFGASQFEYNGELLPLLVDLIEIHPNSLVLTYQVQEANGNCILDYTGKNIVRATIELMMEIQ